MTSAWIRAGLALLAGTMLLMRPGEALEHAKEGMALWANAFAPALFPFFVITPALCCEEVQALCERLFGRLTLRLFGVPGRCAGALAIATMAGSPAGSAALGRSKGTLTATQTTRALLMCSGLSPAFFISCVGQAVLGSAALGGMLLRSCALSVLYSALLLRSAFAQDQASLCVGVPEKAEKQPMRGAVLGMLSVCGWIVCFHVLIGLLEALLPFPALAIFLHPLLEISGGCFALARASLSPFVKLVLMSFCLGFGGLAVLLQNAATFPEVRKARLVLGKLLQGLLAALFTCLQTALPLPCASVYGIRAVTCITAAALPIAAYIAHGIFKRAVETPHETLAHG